MISLEIALEIAGTEVTHGAGGPGVTTAILTTETNLPIFLHFFSFFVRLFV